MGGLGFREEGGREDEVYNVVDVVFVFVCVEVLISVVCLCCASV